MLDERQPHLHRLFHHICHIACLQFAHQVVAVKFYSIVDDGKNEKTELAAVAQQKGKQASNADAQKEDIQAPAGTQQSTEKEETGVLMDVSTPNRKFRSATLNVHSTSLNETFY